MTSIQRGTNEEIGLFTTATWFEGGQYLLALIREWECGLPLMDPPAYIREHEETRIRLYTTATWCLGAVLIGPNKGVGKWLDFDQLVGQPTGRKNSRIRLYTTATWCRGWAVLIGRLMGSGDMA